MAQDNVPRAVVLAAGDGGRLGAHTATLPKPLVPLHGKPIIQYTLEALAAAGVREAVIVTGYMESLVHTALAEGAAHGIALTFVSNPRFHDGASLSLRAARAATGADPFLLVMSDHLLSTELIARLAAGAAEGGSRDSFVAADRSHHDPAYIEEATKLSLAGDGRVVAIGKALPAWDALDTGAFFFAPAAWEAVDAVPEDCELSVICTELARRGELTAADVSGASWYDVDTPDDLAAAAAVVPA